MAIRNTFSSLAAIETTASSLTATCPACDHEFEVGESILSKLRQQAESDFNSLKLKHEQEIESRTKGLEQRELKFKEEQAKHAQLIEDRVNSEVSSKLQSQYPELLRRAREAATIESQQQLVALKTDLDSKATELAKLHVDQAALEKSQRELTAEKSRFELDKQRAISDALSQEREALRVSIGQDFQ